MTSQYPHPSNTNRVSLDPSATGTPIRIILAADALLTVAFGTGIFLYPHHAASYLALEPSLITPLVETLIQIFAVFMYTIAFKIMLCLPNSRRAIETRIPTFYMLAYSEVLLIAFFTYLFVFKSEKESGISEKAVASAAVNMAPPLAFRVFVLVVKPHWVGRYADGAKRA
ncbi:hypothetical protein EJ04DRAFT_508283 [Polyplosphaeria fusca]|uniref:Uncharacterized protein n=1 Tax=Polyplosphaeria fusca TaxID=682080 RepID=A0A9P4R6K0_9PLEO|nr:hypothetical protein EJ04DRAFT_508283 [Polyplosphaeria fusca]